MTRLTNQMRTNLLQAATKAVPVIKYGELLAPIIQEVLCAHMTPKLYAAYKDEASRPYLQHGNINIRDGNQRSTMSILKSTGEYVKFYGLLNEYHTLNIHESALGLLAKGTWKFDVAHAVIKSGYYHKHWEQEQLLASVKTRLNATLQGVSTIKRLYDVLEPELHHLIPKETSATINLPATAGPVVEDLRKLGATLPAL